MYLGRGIDKLSNVEVLDNITFDGSSSYTLQKNSANFTPSSANNILVSIDGVVQSGNFTVSGSTIDFGTAIAGTSTCNFIIHYGIGLITTPADGTVTTAKLADSSVSLAKLTATGTKDATTFLRGDNTFASAGGVNTPAFLAGATVNQTISNNTATLIQYNTELFDTDSCYNNTAGNYSFTPNVAGKYYVFSSIRMDTATDFDYLQIEILKNNTSPPIAFSNMRSEFYEHLKCFTIVDMNGTTDYLQSRVYHSLGSNLDTNTGGANYICQFGGYKIIE